MSFTLNIVVFWLLATRLTGFFLLAPGVQDMEVPKLVKVAVIVWLLYVFGFITHSGDLVVPVVK